MRQGVDRGAPRSSWPTGCALFTTGAIAAFLVLAVGGHRRLDPEVPMRVPAIVVLHAFPLLAVAIVLVVPPGAMSRSVAFLASRFVATASYIVSLATLIRVTEARARTN